MAQQIRIPGVIPTVEFDSQLRGVVRRDRSRDRNIDESPRPARRRMASRFPRYVVILDEDLPAADNFKTGPTKALATVLEWSTEHEIYRELDWQLEVWNHSESTDYERDTPGVADYITGHYWFLGDCDAMSNRGGGA